jgi:hypothetical protein
MTRLSARRDGDGVAELYSADPARRYAASRKYSPFSSS